MSIAALGRRRRRGGEAAFSPASLFASGEQGVWYDASDLTTMFQNTTGTAPVTAVEQPVRLMLDKSRGAQREELPVVGWALQSGDGVVTVADNVVTITGATTVTRVDIVPSGWNIGDFASVTLSASIAGATGATMFIGGTPFTLSNGSQTIGVVISSSALCRVQVTTGTATFTFASRSRIVGSHATASADARRPVLSARVNLLERTEEFNNAYWSLSAATITANAGVSPDGTNTADQINLAVAFTVHGVFRSVATVASVSQTISVYLKAGTSSIGFVGSSIASEPFAYFDVSGSGSVGNVQTGCTADIQSVGNGWFRCRVVGPAASATTRFAVFIAQSNGVVNFSGSGTETLLVWGADFRPTNDGVNLPAYQRVTSSTDYDTAGFPRYLRFDGTDDCLFTGDVDFSATDKVTVCAGVRKLSDAAAAVLMETGPDSGATNGTFGVFAPGSAVPRFDFSNRGTIHRLATVNNAVYAAPQTRVLTGLGDISGNLSVLRLDREDVATVTDGLGTGNYASARPLFVGARNDASVRFNGRLYQLVVRGALTGTPLLEQLEGFVNQKTRAY